MSKTATHPANSIAGEHHEENLAIRVRGLINRFGAQTVHDGLDMDVRRGEILGVVGGSGTGKSVLMRTILGLHIPNAGWI
ncbi:MAG TPA: ATP-binding cassette domain-containing protein, partial [Xylella taiwanensis]